MRKVKLRLVGLDGNAFFLMGAFRQAARSQGFDNAFIEKVLDECMSSDYNNLLMTLLKYTEDDDGDD